MLETENPYQSPRAPTLRPLDEDRPWIDALRVQRFEKRFLYRRVVIEAPLEADLEYHGITVGRESITIDKQIAIADYGLLWFVPRFEFELRSGGKAIPVVVEVRVGLLLNIRAFRIEIAGQTVYLEGRL